MVGTDTFDYQHCILLEEITGDSLRIDCVNIILIKKCACSEILSPFIVEIACKNIQPISH